MKKNAVLSQAMDNDMLSTLTTMDLVYLLTLQSHTSTQNHSARAPNDVPTIETAMRSHTSLSTEACVGWNRKPLLMKQRLIGHQRKELTWRSVKVRVQRLTSRNFKQRYWNYVSKIEFQLSIVIKTVSTKMQLMHKSKSLSANCKDPVRKHKQSFKLAKKKGLTNACVTKFALVRTQRLQGSAS